MEPAFTSAVTTKGLEFIELTTPDADALGRYLSELGFKAVAKHRHKPVLLYRQGTVNLIVNSAKTGSVHDQALEKGVSVCAIAVRVEDAQAAYQTLLDRGAWEAETQAGVMELNIPAIEGVGGTQIFLVDRFDGPISIYDVDFVPLDGTKKSIGPAQVSDQFSLNGLTASVAKGRVAQWQDFFAQLLGFERLPNGDVTAEGFTLRFDESRLPADAEVGDEGYTAIRLNTAQSSTPSLPASLKSTLNWVFEAGV
jgi:4-hydroxyphenylpyruvate dioxygenase